MNTQKNLKPDKYLDHDQLPFAFCPGCGHGMILKALDQALLQLQYDHQEVVIVTDIGCVGLSDRYFKTHSFHGLHGRSITYATGIKLANPNLKVIVLIGDGGCGIGGHHLINAARRNIGVTTLVFNNLNYGMTGGEHSVTTPLGSITSTTRRGQIENPLDICSTVLVNGGSFVARTTAFDIDLSSLISKAIQHKGFSLIDIWELCTAYFAPNNRFKKSTLLETIDKLGFETGILSEKDKPDYISALQNLNRTITNQDRNFSPSIDVDQRKTLSDMKCILLAGSAGSKIVTTASLFAVGAIRSGLWVTQRDDYPVTVKSGHSISQLTLSPVKIRYTGKSKPDIIVALFQEGLEKTRHLIKRLDNKDTLIISLDLPNMDTQANKVILDFNSVRGIGKKKEYRALLSLAFILHEFDLYPLDSFKEAIILNSKYANEQLTALEDLPFLINRQE